MTDPTDNFTPTKSTTLGEMDKFLKKYKVPKLTQGEIEILNSPLLKENEFATKNVFIIKL